MNSCASRQRKSFSEMQPFCWIMSGAHSVFQTRTALSVSEGSILMWMRRMIDMAFLLARCGGWRCQDNARCEGLVLRCAVPGRRLRSADRLANSIATLGAGPLVIFNA